MPTAATTNLTIATLLDLTAASATPAAPADDGLAFDAVLQAPPRQPATDHHRDSSQQPEVSAPPVREEPPATQQSTETHSPKSDANDSATVGEELVSRDSDESQEPASEADDEAITAANTLIEQSLAAISIPVPTTAEAEIVPTQDITVDAESEEPGVQKSSKHSKRVSARSSNDVVAGPKTAVAEASTTTSEQPIVIDQPSDATSEASNDPAAAIAGNEIQQLAADTASVSPSDPKASAEALDQIVPTSGDASPENASQQQEATGDDASNDQPTATLANGNSAPDTASAPATQSTAPVIAPAVAPTAASDRIAAATDRGSSPNITAAAPASRNRLPGQLLTNAEGPAPRRGTVEVDANRLLSRVARAFAAAQERDGEVQLRLSPPELGSIRLEVRIQDGAMIAHLEAETEAARTAIVENLPALRERLAEQGVRIERFDVDLMQRQPTGTPNQSGGGQQDAPQPAQRPAMTLRRAAEPTSPTQTNSYSPTTAGGLNVIV
jgi:flagellar hook-length control protein FliK